MRLLFALIYLTLFPLSTLAMGPMICSAMDKRWEEHWGGHRTCNDCLKKHSTCIEVCTSSYEFICEAKGVNHLGQVKTLKAAGADRYTAERNALNVCYKGQYTHCNLSLCHHADLNGVIRRNCTHETPPEPTPEPEPEPNPNPEPNPDPTPDPQPEPEPSPEHGRGPRPLPH